ncbi:MAG: beta strand repeat-containing protein, partial [Actinomycetota bacterium]
MARATHLERRRHVVGAWGLSGALLMGVLFALFSASPPAGAATTTITVTGTGDAGGACSGDSCPTLRGAVALANGMASSPSSPIVIQLAAGTTTLTGGVITIGSATNLDVTVEGAVSGSPSGSVISQSTMNGIFLTPGTSPNAIVNLIDLTIENGHAGGFGGGALQAGAVPITATGESTTITDCVFMSNTATKGGAITFASGGDLTITDSTFTGNVGTDGTGGAIDFFSDGGHGASQLTISGSTFTNNSITGEINGGANGGAVFYNGGGTSSLSVTTSLFSGNSAGSAAGAGGEGAGILIQENNGNTDSITKSTFVNNTAINGAATNATPQGEGGGVWTNDGILTLSDSRLVGNVAADGPSVWESTNGGSANVNDDWWGINTGPGTNVAGGTGAVFTKSSWLQLRNLPAASTLLPGGSTTVQADILGLNTGGALASSALTGLAPFPASGVFSNPVDETLNTTATQFVNGIATTGVTVGNILGSDAATDVATADSQMATDDINVKANSTTSVPTNSPSTSVFGQPVTLGATLSSASGATSPTVPQGGTVQFKVDGANVGSPAAVSSGSASLVDSSMAVGTHAVTAVYSGDADFNTSTSASGASQIVNKADTAAVVSSSLNPSFAGQSVTFSVTLTAVSPGAGTPGGTGSVQFEDNGDPLGLAQTPVGGVASISTSSLSVSTHNVTAVYAGDGNFNGTTGTLAVPGQVVKPAPTSVNVTPSFDPSVFGQPVTFTATVNAVLAGTPAGFVQFGLNGVNLGTGETLVSGQAVTPVLTNLAVGSTNVTATYTPTDGVHAGSSGLFTQTVNKANTTTTIGSSANPTNAGTPLSFTATVTAVSPGAGTPGGTVDFVIDGG